MRWGGSGTRGRSGGWPQIDRGAVGLLDAAGID